jgi:hypothetical protein
LEAIGLKRAPTPNTEPGKAYREINIPDAVFSYKDYSPQSKITLRFENFTFRDSKTHQVNIEVVEITWSELTQWLKTKQIGHDLQDPEKSNAAFGKTGTPLWCVKGIDNKPKDKPTKLPVLDIVAFSDTDDILSWPIPAWYMGGQICAPKLRIVNAYVHNTTRWFGLVANPGAAHSGYFTNPDVWNLMRCGAKEGKLRPC